MKIGIVEDEAVWRDKIKAVIEKYCVDKSVSAQIITYDNGRDFMENADVDLLFLDIELAEGGDGFKIAEKLLDSGSQCKICFLTSHTEMARQGYRVNAFRYIDKKYLEEIGEALDSFFKTKIQERNIYCKDTAGIRIKINLSEHFCEGRISETAQSLSPFGFFYVQRSYIVNLKYIESVNSREIMLCNGLKIAIGRVHGREFKKEFFKWRMLSED